MLQLACMLRNGPALLASSPSYPRPNRPSQWWTSMGPFPYLSSGIVSHLKFLLRCFSSVRSHSDSFIGELSGCEPRMLRRFSVAPSPSSHKGLSQLLTALGRVSLTERFFS